MSKNTWIQYVKLFREKNPHISYKEAMENATESYRIFKTHLGGSGAAKAAIANTEEWPDWNASSPLDYTRPPRENAARVSTSTVSGVRVKPPSPTLEQQEAYYQQRIIDAILLRNKTDYKLRFYDGEKITFKPKVYNGQMLVASGIEYHFSYRKQTNDFEYNGQYYQTPFHVIIKMNIEHEIKRQVEKETDAKAKFAASQERIKERLAQKTIILTQRERTQLYSQLMDYEKYKLLHTPPTPQVKCRMGMDEAMRRRDANETKEVAIFNGKVKKIVDDWKNNCYITRDGVTNIWSKFPNIVL